MVDTVNSVNASTTPRFTSRAEFARLAGVSRAAVTKACRGPLGAALVERIDLDHPAAVAYQQRSRAEGAELADGASTPPPSRAELAREVRNALRRLEAAIAAYVTASDPALPGDLFAAASSSPQVVDAGPEAREAECEQQPGAAVRTPADGDQTSRDRGLGRARLDERHDAAHDTSVARAGEVSR
jgi:hypothetical protein